LEVIHTPGHTAGSISLYWEREAMLFTGDSVQGLGLFPGWLPYYFHAERYNETLLKLIEKPLATICLGHRFQAGKTPDDPVRKKRDAISFMEMSLEAARIIGETALAEIDNVSSFELKEILGAILNKLQKHFPAVSPNNELALPFFAATIKAHYDSIRNKTS